jgi:hypothetical protein
MYKQNFKYDFKELQNNLTKSYFKKFKRFYKKSTNRLGKENCTIELMQIYQNTDKEPISSASFERNLVRAIKEIRTCKDPEELIFEKIEMFNVINSSYKKRLTKFFEFNLTGFIGLSISFTSLYLTYCRIKDIVNPFTYLFNKLF